MSKKKNINELNKIENQLNDTNNLNLKESTSRILLLSNNEIVCSCFTTIIIYNINKRKNLKIIYKNENSHDKQISSLSLSSDNSFISSSFDGTIKLWYKNNTNDYNFNEYNIFKKKINFINAFELNDNKRICGFSNKAIFVFDKKTTQIINIIKFQKIKTTFYSSFCFTDYQNKEYIVIKEESKMTFINSNSFENEKIFNKLNGIDGFLTFYSKKQNKIYILSLNIKNNQIIISLKYIDKNLKLLELHNIYIGNFEIEGEHELTEEEIMDYYDIKRLFNCNFIDENNFHFIVYLYHGLPFEYENYVLYQCKKKKNNKPICEIVEKIGEGNIHDYSINNISKDYDENDRDLDFDMIRLDDKTLLVCSRLKVKFFKFNI